MTETLDLPRALPAPRFDEGLTQPYIDLRGRPTLGVQSTSFGSIGSRQQLQALFLQDPTEDTYVSGVGAALMSGANWEAHFDNRAAVRDYDLGFIDTGEGLLDQQNNVVITDVKPSDVPNIISPDVKYILDSRGFDYSVLDNAKDVNEAVGAVEKFLLLNQLQDRIQFNTDGWIEAAAGTVGSFGLDVVTDPLTIASLGSGALLKAGATKAAKSVLVKQAGKSTGLTPVQRFVVAATERGTRNSTISGSIVDNTFTRSHAGLMQGVDTAVFMTAFDAAAQYTEGEMEGEFLNPEADHWDPVRSGFSAIAGFGLGSLVGHYFLTDKVKANNIRINRLMSGTDNAVFRNSDEAPSLLRRPEEALTVGEITEDMAVSMTNKHLDSFEPHVRSDIKILQETSTYDTIEYGRFMATKPSHRDILDYFGVANDELGYQLTLQKMAVQKQADRQLVAARKSGKTRDMEKYQHSLEAVRQLDINIALARNPVRPEEGTLKTLVDELSKKRARYIEAVDDGLGQDDLRTLQRDLFASSDEIDAHINEIVGEFRGPAQKDLIEYSQSLDTPLRTPIPKEKQADILSALTNAGTLEFPLNAPNVTSKVLNWRGFNYIAGLGTRRHDIETATRKSSYFSLVANMIHPLAHTNSTLKPGQDSVVSLSALYRRNRARLAQALEEPTEALYRRAGGDTTGLNRDLAKALRVAAGIDSTDDELIAELAFGYRKFYDDMLADGQRVGVMGPGLEEFVHITLNPASANKHFDYLSTSLSDWYKNTYKKADLDTELHKATLLRTEILDQTRALNKTIKGWEQITKTPRKREDLVGLEYEDGTSVLARYDRELDGVLDEHARNAIHNKVNPVAGKQLSDMVDDEAKAGRVNASERSDMDRRIEQEFFLQEDILEKGIVELNPILNGMSYNFGTGTRIAKQDAVNRVTGRADITWDGLVEMARRDLHANMPNDISGNRGANALIESLIDAERDLSGKNIAMGEGELSMRALATNARNIASVPVQSGIPIAMSTVELPAMIMTMMTKDGLAGVSRTQRALLSVLTDGNFSKDQLRAVGKSMDFYTREMRHLADNGFTDQALSFRTRDRIFRDPVRDIKDAWSGARTPRGVQGSDSRGINTLTAVTQALSDATRASSGEEFLTGRGRAALIYYHLQMPWEHLDKLVTLAGTSTDGSLKALKGAARDAGFGGNWKLAKEFVEYGLTGREFVEGASILRAAGADDMFNAAQVNRALAGISDHGMRKKAQEAYNKLLDYANQSADNLIINPSVWDRPSHAQHPIIQLVNTFLSYPRGFRSNRLRPLASNGAASVAFWSAFYLQGELLNKQLQAVVFEDKSVSDLMTDWSDDPKSMLYRGLASVPFLGPYQNALMAFASSALGRHEQIRLGGSPGLGITGRLIEDLVAVGRGAVDGYDDRDVERFQRLEKFVPGLNWIPVQAAETAVRSALSDE